MSSQSVVVIGAGVFGAWTALRLREAGCQVTLLDAYGPGNSRSSSGGETRIIRMSYGPDELYARWSVRSLHLWQEFERRRGHRLFHGTGVLWLAKQGDQYTAAGADTLDRLQSPIQRLSNIELQRRYPQFELSDIVWGFLEPNSGCLMARRAVQAVVEGGVAEGVVYRQLAVLQPPNGPGRRLESLHTAAGETISADMFIFACGPWLPKLFPDVIGPLMFPTRQEVFFFGIPAGDTRFAAPAMPIWLCLSDGVYGFPDIDTRGVKVAIDGHGSRFDPDTGSRVPSIERQSATQAALAHRIPMLADAPVVEARVCQYENTWNGDFLIDRHPNWENVWFCGGGSGHGFKHGPMVGEYISGQILGATDAPEPRFSLASKQPAQQRGVF